MGTTIPIIEAWLGDTNTISIQIRQNKQPMDITGYTLSWLISTNREDEEPLVEQDVTEHDNEGEGLSHVSFTPAEMEVVGKGVRWLTCLLVDEDDKEITRLVSKLKVWGRPQRTVPET